MKNQHLSGCTTRIFSFFTTIHQVKVPENHILRPHHRSRTTGANTKTVRPIFGGNHTYILRIPALINLQNLFMGTVDLANQRRSHLPIRLCELRSRLPLCFWCFDRDIIDAFTLYGVVGVASTVLAKNIMISRKGISELVLERTSSIQHQRPPSAYITTKHRQSTSAPLPTSRPQPRKHIQFPYSSDTQSGHRASCNRPRCTKPVERTAATHIHPFVTGLGSGRSGGTYSSWRITNATCAYLRLLLML